jgi:hypothetical protein
VALEDLQDAALVLHRVVDVRWIAALELHPMRAVGLLAGDVGLLF